MKKTIGILSLAAVFITVSCNNSGKDDEDVKIKKESTTIEKKAPEKENVIEVPLPPPPPPPPTPKEVIKKLKELPKPPLPPLPPPPPLPKKKG